MTNFKITKRMADLIQKETSQFKDLYHKIGLQSVPKKDSREFGITGAIRHLNPKA